MQKCQTNVAAMLSPSLTNLGIFLELSATICQVQKGFAILQMAKTHVGRDPWLYHRSNATVLVCRLGRGQAYLDGDGPLHDTVALHAAHGVLGLGRRLQCDEGVALWGT